MAKRYKGTPTATLQTIHDALVTYLESGTVAAGIASYTIAGRSVDKWSLKEVLDELNDLSNELAVRKLPDPSEVILVEFDEPDDGPEFRRGTVPW